MQSYWMQADIQHLNDILQPGHDAHPTKLLQNYDIFN